jgi:ubiquinone/menaquinone biosynthesis C-methylase UbiE
VCLAAVASRSQNATRKTIEVDAHTLKDRYYGSLAATYDRERVNTPLWNREQEAVERFLKGMGRGLSVIDAPIGTGRFLSAYHNLAMQVTGLDASTEMLAQAAEKADTLGAAASFQQGDLRRLPFDDGTFDIGVCIRFLNWVKGADLDACIRELSRVTKGSVLLGIRSFAPLSEIDLRRMSSLKHHLLQAKLRIYQARTRATFVYHEPGRVKHLFAAHGLTVRERTRIPIKMAGEYSIYLLTRTA